MATYIGNKHTVQSGESLSAIAAKYGTDWQTLYALNKDHLRSGNPNVIYPGENLVLPGDSTNESGTTQQPIEANEPNTVKERNQGTVVVSRPYGTEPGSSSEKVISDDSYDIEIKKVGTNKPASDAISGDVSALENARQQMQIAQDAQNNVANENKLLVKQLEAKNKLALQNFKVKNKVRIPNIDGATKAKNIAAIIPNKKLETNPKVIGIATNKTNAPTQNYKIKSGESFWTIAKQLNLPYNVLINTGNNIGLYNKRKNGQLQTNDVIQIPIPKATHSILKYLPDQRLNSDIGKGYAYIPPSKLQANPARVGNTMDGVFDGFLEAIIGEVESLVDTVKTVGSSIIRYSPMNPYFIENVYNDFKKLSKAAQTIYQILKDPIQRNKIIKAIIDQIGGELQKFWNNLIGSNGGYKQGVEIGKILENILMLLLPIGAISKLLKEGTSIGKVADQIIQEISKAKKKIYDATIKPLIEKLTTKVKQNGLIPIFGKLKDEIEDLFAHLPYMVELRQIKGITVRHITKAELNRLNKFRKENNIIGDRNIAILDTRSLTHHTNTREFKSYSGFDQNNVMAPEFVKTPSKGSLIFDAPHTHNYGKLHDRTNDSESKLLEQLAQQLNAKPGDFINGKTYPKIKGKIKLFSELCPCASCAKLIEQFKTVFPNIDIELISTNIEKMADFKKLIK
jgi:LysM repeat protein